MAIVDLQWLKGTQFFTDANEVLASGTINIYDAGTTSLRTTYSDAAGTVANTLNGSNQIVLASDGRLDESVYIPTGAWKVTVKDSGGTTIFTEDNIEGALDTDALAVTEALPSTPVISKTSNYTILNADQGKVINANPTGGSFVLTLPSASTVGDGWRITIRHVGTAGTVTIAAVTSQTINGATSRALGSQYESLCLVSDGANWHIDGHAEGFSFNAGKVPFLFVESRTLTAPPASPTAGARYIAAGSGTLTGDWSSYSNNDILESNGQGGWIQYTPAEGWHAYDKNANQDVLCTGSAWEGLPSTDEPLEVAIGIAVYQYQQAAGTNGGAATTSSWATYPLNTEVSDDGISGSIATNIVTLPTGDYELSGLAPFVQTGVTRLRWYNITDAAVAIYGTVTSCDTTSGEAVALISGIFSVTDATETFRLEYYAANNAGAAALGAAQGVGVTETYGQVKITSRISQQGTTGDQGPQGPQGFAGFKYQYSTTTTQTDPGAGIIRLNNADLSLVTAAVIDATSNESGNPDISDEIAGWTDGGILKIAKIAAEQNFVTYDVTVVTDNTGYLSLTLVYRDHAGSFSNTDAVSLGFTPKGSTGTTGSTIPVYDYQFNTTTSGDPGSGKVLFDNATLSSATAVSVSDLDRIAVDRSSDVATWDDDGATTNRGYLYGINATTGAAVFTFKMTGTITDNTTYQTMSGTYVSGAAPANNTRIAIMFVPAGPTGTVGGSTGATDNAILRANGTGGSTLQNSPTLMADDGSIVFPEMAAPSTPGAATVVVYPKSDGRLYEKDDAGTERGLSSVGKQTLWIPARAMWARITNGPSAASRELATGGDIMIVGWDFDATTEEGVQFYIAFPDSWNKSTVTFKAYWTNAAGLTTETVSWGLSIGAFTDDDPIDSTDLGTEVRVSDTWLAQNDLHVTAESTAVTVGNTPVNDDLCIGQIVRSVANDNMTGDVTLLGIKIYPTTSAATDG